MSRCPDYLAASRSAAEVARWAMFHAAHKTPYIHGTTLMTDLERCAAALGYKLVKADAPADVVLGR